MNQPEHRGPVSQPGHQNRLRAGESRSAEPSHGMIGAIKDRAEDMASSVASVAEGAWDATREGVGQAASAVATTAEEAWDEVTACMRRYPVATFLTGIGLGFLLANAFGSSGPRNWLRGDWGGYAGPSSGGGYPFAK